MKITHFTISIAVFFQILSELVLDWNDTVYEQPWPLSKSKHSKHVGGNEQLDERNCQKLISYSKRHALATLKWIFTRIGTTLEATTTVADTA